MARGDAYAESSRGTRVAIALACTVCKARNYKTSKAPDTTLELKKFCKTCKQHTLHRDTK